MLTSPKVYIILVNYKNWQDTTECLESLFKLTYPNFKVIVIDNDSQNNSIEFLKSWADGKIEVQQDERFYAAAPVEPKPIGKPIQYQCLLPENMLEIPADQAKLILIESGQNLGFAGGNNLGIKLALAHHADYIWLLNNDTVVESDALSHLLECFSKHRLNNRRLGILGAKLLYYHNPNLVQAVLGRYIPLTASTTHIGLNQPSSASFAEVKIEKNDYIVGASMLVSADFIKEVGPMSEDYFLYFEEIDWVKRGGARGYTIDICLNARVYHKEGVATGGSAKDNNSKSELSDFYSIRNRLIITRKFFPGYKLPVYLSLAGVALNRIRRRQFSRIPLIVKAFKSSFSRTL